MGSRAHYGSGLAELRGQVPNQAQQSEAKSRNTQQHRDTLDLPTLRPHLHPSGSRRDAMVAEWDAQVEINRQRKEAEKAEKRRQDIEDLINEAQMGSVVSAKAHNQQYV